MEMMCMAHEFKWGLPQFGNARFRPDWCGLGSSASLDSGMPATRRESSRLFSEKLQKVWENCCQSCCIMLYHVVMLCHVASALVRLKSIKSCQIPCLYPLLDSRPCLNDFVSDHVGSWLQVCNLVRSSPFQSLISRCFKNSHGNPWNNW